MALAPNLRLAPAAFIRWLVLFALANPVLGQDNPAGSVSPQQRYSYILGIGKERALCRHLQKVYNERFSQPWKYNTYDFPAPWFPPLTTGQQKPDVQVGLYSRFPSSPEFDAIPWKEAVLLAPVVTSSVLIAEFDIDNDGHGDLVLKQPLMDPWRSGGTDTLVVLNRDQIDLKGPIDYKDVYFGPEGLPRPALISNGTLGFVGSLIRPLIYDGTTYLSVHESGARQSIWILLYKGGGEKSGLAHPAWRPLEVERLCRLRMIPNKQNK